MLLVISLYLNLPTNFFEEARNLILARNVTMFQTAVLSSLIGVVHYKVAERIRETVEKAKSKCMEKGLGESLNDVI
uniref:Uncharacterized protein n=1 Tax=Candidatus Kentrum sp. FW TaxID=2126338 RepID=A0A450SRN3_9GAMM|nr:MAG: hypothetical protein BECKFW1821A_GA0114235_106217 [Candidatus Kentron sp. FW]